MAAPLETKTISAEDAQSIYGFKVDLSVEISGMNLTAEKIKTLMAKASIIANGNWHHSAKSMQNFSKFQAFCRAEGVEVTFK